MVYREGIVFVAMLLLIKTTSGSPPANCLCQRTPSDYVSCDGVGCSIGNDDANCHGGYRMINVNDFYVKACACPGYTSSVAANYYASCSAFGAAVTQANSSIITGTNCCTYCCGTGASSILAPCATLLLALVLLVF